MAINRCSKCDSPNVQHQVVSETNKRGCLSTLLYIILLCVPVIGWIALFLLLRGRKSKTITYTVCQDCGHRHKV